MDSENKKYKILLTGGGTGGSVAPLLAVAEELKTSPQPSPSQGEGEIPPTPFDKGGDNLPSPPYQEGGGDFEFLWLGTKSGPEREMVASASSAQGSGIKFKAISGGKWRRYFSFKNLADILKIKLGFWQALWLMLKWRPDLVMSAGSFVSVPVVWAAWLLKVPVLIHQQDVRAGLANKLMAPFAKAATVTFEESIKDYEKKAAWTGNPARRSLEYPISNIQYPINSGMPIVLVLGGGTGAEAINRLVAESLGELTKFCQIIQVTGKNKNKNIQYPISNIQYFEFLNAEKMASAMKAADLVVTRAGMSTLTELSFLGKPAIIIPISDSHQEANAEFFRKKKAAIVAEQKYLTVENFTQLVKDSLADKKNLARLSENMAGAMKKGAREEMVKIIKSLLK